MGARRYRSFAILLAVLTFGIGLALIVTTLARGGGMVGILLGLLFLAAGAGRLYLARGGRR